MIKIEDTIIKQETFGDGTLKCPIPPIASARGFIYITWCYDNDAELFCLWSLVGHIRQQHPTLLINLCMPYIPHARQDRNVSNRLFTLKYFAELINLMKFNRVFVLDPHSDVSMALIDRVEESDLPFRVSPKDEQATIMFPDNGAAKKYAPRYQLEPTDNPFIIGNKHRNTDGRIESYELMNFVEGTKSVIIRDDICSYGGTFVAAAKELRKRGVEHITLVVSHCENNILKGEVFDYIDAVFTTDSICTVSHPKLKVAKRYREGLLNVQN